MIKVTIRERCMLAVKLKGIWHRGHYRRPLWYVPEFCRTLKRAILATYLSSVKQSRTGEAEVLRLADKALQDPLPHSFPTSSLLPSLPLLRPRSGPPGLLTLQTHPCLRLPVLIPLSTELLPVAFLQVTSSVTLSLKLKCSRAPCPSSPCPLPQFVPHNNYLLKKMD